MIDGDDQPKTILHEHHIIPGTAGRIKSEELGLKVNLCVRHHMLGPDAVHENAEKSLLLKRIAQAEYERRNGHEKWMQEIGKNYL